MRRHQFTMVEILTVMAIIGILAGITLTVFPTITRKSKISRTQGQLKGLETILELYKEEWGFFPPTKDAGGNAPKVLSSSWYNGIVKDNSNKTNLIDNSEMGFATSAETLPNGDTYMYVDPFGKPYYYQCPGRINTEKYDLWSTGPDGAHGTQGIDDDNDGEDESTDYDEAQTTVADDSDDITNWKRN